MKAPLSSFRFSLLLVSFACGACLSVRADSPVVAASLAAESNQVIVTFPSFTKGTPAAAIPVAKEEPVAPATAGVQRLREIIAGTATMTQAEKDAFFASIKEIESGGDYAKVGSRGELGAFQFRRFTWRQHTKCPFSQARTLVADTIAERHFDWLKSQLLANGIKPTPWLIAAAWNAGCGSVVRGSIPHVARDYANRAINLMASRLCSQSVAKAVPLTPPAQPPAIFVWHSPDSEPPAPVKDTSEQPSFSVSFAMAIPSRLM